MTTDQGFTCPRCGATSYHPQDRAEGYCGECRWWTGDSVLGQVDPANLIDGRDDLRDPAALAVLHRVASHR